jgi:DNA gyrase subunit A
LTLFLLKKIRMSDPITPPPEQPLERIEELNIERELQESYLTYAMSTIMDRALPDVRDGLKPSQRRILVAMNDLNLTPGRKHLKCAKIAGNTSGDYHPHGEAIVYPTLVRMAQDWSMRHKLIDGQGNFGSADGDNAAAMRYTEARMASPMVDMLADLNLDTVDFQPNYDERLMEPTVLPGRFPNLLVNGSTGIAVGMACNHLPHNLREICDAIVRVIDNPQIQLGELMSDVVDEAGKVVQLGVKGPDFPAGGIICGVDGIVNGYATGRSRVTLRCKLHVEEKGTRKSIVIDEMPYGVMRKSIIEALAESAKIGRISDVSAANDESGRLHKCRIVIDLKRDGDPDVVINQLYQFTPAQVTVSMINIALVNRQPRTMGLKELIQHFIAHRFEVITRRTKFLLRKAQQRGHILEGLIFAVLDIDEVVRLIRSSKTREEAIEKLRQRAFRIPPGHPSAPTLPKVLYDRAGDPNDAAAGWLLSQAQAEAIGALRLIQLVGLEIEQLVKDYAKIVEEIEGYERILADDRLKYDIIREDTIEIRDKYGDDRRTEIDPFAGGVVDMEALIAKEDVVVTLSHSGYVKRLRTDTYVAQGRGGRGIKGGETRENDFIEHLFVANTHDYLLFFTNTGRVFEKRVFDVPEMSRTSVGRAAANLMDFQAGEKIANVLAIKDFEKAEQYLMFATAKGVVKKTALSAYGNIRTNGIIAISLDEGDELIGVEITNGQDHIILGTKSGLAIRFEESDVRAMGRPAGGVTGARFKRDGDRVVSMIVVPNGDNTNCTLLTACVNGFGKRTPLGEYPVKGRGTRGVINIDASDRNGDVVGIKSVCDTDELMLITENGILIRTRINEIRETGRNAAGVRLIRIDSGDRLVAMAKIDVQTTEADKPVTEDGQTEAQVAEEIKAEAAEDAVESGGAQDADVPDADDTDSDKSPTA